MPFHIHLYDEPDAPGLDIAEVGGFLVAQFPGLDVEVRRDFLTHQFARFTPEQQEILVNEVARQVGGARLAGAPTLDPIITLPEDPEDLEADHVLSAAGYQAILRLLVDPEESSAEHLHLVFTDISIGTQDDVNEPPRLHIICMGDPTLVSVPGMSDALPQPREYQFRRAQIAMLGLGEDALDDLEDSFADRTFGYADPRINEVCKGYALMACFYRMFGEAFCDEPDCRLHAARNQEQLIAIQCGPKASLCARHEAMRRQHTG